MSDYDFHSGHPRRSLIKAGIVTSTGATLGVTGVGDAFAQDDEDEETLRTGLMFNDEFRPEAQFRIISAPIDQTPALDGVPESIWNDFAVRALEYLVTGEEALLFPATDAEVSHGEVYEFQSNFSRYEGGAAEGLIEVQFEPVPAEDRVIDDGAILERGQDYQVQEENVAKALVPLDAYYGDGLFTVVSGVEEWTPTAIDRAADRGTDYNTRFGSYLNADDESLLYVPTSAHVTEGAVYVMREAFTIRDRQAGIVEVTVDRVDEETIHETLR